MKKWYHLSQAEIKKELQTKFDNTQLLDQTITDNAVFEKYLVQKENDAFIMLYQITKDSTRTTTIFRFRNYEPFSYKFIDYFRSDKYLKEMTDQECKEIFKGALRKSKNLTVELLNEVLTSYNCNFRVEKLK